MTHSCPTRRFSDLLLIAGYTLNIQSYMGAIMAVGLAIANAILYVTNAESLRKAGNQNAHMTAATNRIRPILMTSFAMIAGMLPKALGLGEGGAQNAPLGVAVIGGLLFRSEERRVGKEGVSTGRFRGSPYHEKKK